MTSSSKIWYDYCSLETHQYGNGEMSKEGNILTSLQPEQELDCTTKHIVPKLNEHDMDPSLSEEERNTIYAYYKKKTESMIIITPEEKIWIDTNEVLNKEDDTTHKAFNSDNDQISSSVCCKENKKEHSTSMTSVADFLVNAKKIEINFSAVMESSLKQNNDKNTIVSEIDQTKTEAIESNKIKTEAIESDETKTDAVKSDETTTEAVKSNETKTVAVKSNENKTEAVKSDETNTETIKSDETNTETIKSDETKTEAVKLDETKTEAVKSVETKTKTFKSNDTKIEAVKSNENKTEAVKSGLLEGELATVIYGLLVILLIGPKLITASCILKIPSIELKPPDILLYVNASKDCDYEGVSKWEGGPDNTLLTFGNQSRHKNYQPIQRGRTFDLLIRNATQKEYKARYNFHLKFKNISAYLPILPVYPGKGCFQTHCHVMGETLVVEVHVKAFPEPFFEILFASMNLTEKQEKKLTKKKLFYEGNVNFTYQLPEKSCDGQLNINYYLGAVHGNLFQKVINGCTKSGSYTEAIVVPIVSLLVIAIGIFMCKNKCKEKCCTKNTEHQVEESAQLNGIKITNE